MNQVILSGRLTKDGVLRTFDNTSVLNFTLAVDNKHKVGEEWKNNPVFVECELWDSGATSLSERAKKGVKILVNGQLKAENWEKDGQKRSKNKLRVNKYEVWDNYQKVDAQSVPEQVTQPESGDEIPF